MISVGELYTYRWIRRSSTWGHAIPYTSVVRITYIIIWKRSLARTTRVLRNKWNNAFFSLIFFFFFFSPIRNVYIFVRLWSFNVNQCNYFPRIDVYYFSHKRTILFDACVSPSPFCFEYPLLDEEYSMIIMTETHGVVLGVIICLGSACQAIRIIKDLTSRSKRVLCNSALDFTRQILIFYGKAFFSVLCIERTKKRKLLSIILVEENEGKKKKTKKQKSIFHKTTHKQSMGSCSWLYFKRLNRL